MHLDIMAAFSSPLDLGRPLWLCPECKDTGEVNVKRASLPDLEPAR
jgi:hypothetical protein